MTSFLLAERVGFEPTLELPLTRLAGVRLKPLGHRSSVGYDTQKISRCLPLS